MVQEGTLWERRLRPGEAGLYLRARKTSFTRFSRFSSFALNGERGHHFSWKTRWHSWPAPEQHLSPALCAFAHQLTQVTHLPQIPIPKMSLMVTVYSFASSLVLVSLQLLLAGSLSSPGWALLTGLVCPNLKRC